MQTTIKIGDRVSYAETFHDTNWIKVGVVIDVNEHGRCRVKWEKWIYPSGFERIDTKRTWVKAARLVVLTGEPTPPAAVTPKKKRRSAAEIAAANKEAKRQRLEREAAEQATFVASMSDEAKAVSAAWFLAASNSEAK